MSTETGFDRFATDESGDDLAHEDADDDVDDDWCRGPEMLEDGELCCWPCFTDATDDQRARYRELSGNTVRFDGGGDA